jgi:hypothetical protein
MLQGFETYYKICPSGVHGNFFTPTATELDVLFPVLSVCMVNGFPGKIDSDDRAGMNADKIRPVALSARDIHDLLPGGKVSRERIPVKMFEHNLPGAFGKQSLSGPLETWSL